LINDKDVRRVRDNKKDENGNSRRRKGFKACGEAEVHATESNGYLEMGGVERAKL